MLAIIYQLMGGVRQSWATAAAPRIDELREKAEFVEITSAGMRESHVHDVQITKEAPNYRSRVTETRPVSHAVVHVARVIPFQLTY